MAGKFISTPSYKGVEIQLHSFITSVLDGADWFTSQPRLLTAQEEQW
jgi:hypothetical protein